MRRRMRRKASFPFSRRRACGEGHCHELVGLAAPARLSFAVQAALHAAETPGGSAEPASCCQPGRVSLSARWRPLPLTRKAPRISPRALAKFA